MRFTAIAFMFLMAVSAMRLPSTVDTEGLKIDYLNEPKKCERPVQVGDVVVIDFEGGDF